MKQLISGGYLSKQATDDDSVVLFSLPLFEIERGRIRALDVTLEYIRKPHETKRFKVVCRRKNADPEERPYSTKSVNDTFESALVSFCSVLNWNVQSEPNKIIHVDFSLLDKFLGEASPVADLVPEISIIEARDRIVCLESYAAVNNECQRLLGCYEKQVLCESGNGAPAWFNEILSCPVGSIAERAQEVDLSQTDAHGNTILHRCGDDAERLLALIRAGATINACNAAGDTPLHIHAKHYGVYRDLLSHKDADVTIRNGWGLFALDFDNNPSLLSEEALARALYGLKEKGSLATLRPGHSILTFANTRLIEAINANNKALTEELFSLDFPILFPSGGGFDPYLFPLCMTLLIGDWELVDRLIAKDPDGCAEYLGKVSSYCYHLHNDLVDTAISLSLKHAKQLLSGEDWKRVFESGVSNAQIASYCRRSAIDVNACLGDGNLLLNCAISARKWDRLEVLFSFGADPTCRDHKGWSGWDMVERINDPMLRAAFESGVLKKKTARMADISESIGL